MKAKWNGQVIAESDRTVEMGGYQYFPRDDVKMELLTLAPKTASDLECPHGVQFFDVQQGDRRSERAAWTYESASAPPVKQVEHWVGFWHEVQVVP